MANKTVTGIVVSTKMQGSIVVAVTRKMPHPLYKKLITTTKRYVVGSDKEAKEGDSVTLVETRKTAGKKYFAIKKKGEK